MTNGEYVRSMTDEDLATLLVSFYENEGPDFCERRPECDADLAADRLIPMERCNECMARWLRRQMEVQADG